ncbi:MAG: hypothetical protein JWR61_175 [Ferruginibacter sp.]|jgi:hypothetical protein|nr:hypothetical protein [Ferruginibacter sp.]
MIVELQVTLFDKLLLHLNNQIAIKIGYNL